MITQEYINSEIDLAKRIYIYYNDKLASYLGIGSDKYISPYKDLCILLFLCRGLISIKLIDGLMYIGDTEIDENTFNKYCLNVREYITSDISDIVYAELDSFGNIKDVTRPSTPPNIVTYQGYNQDFRSTIIIVSVDDVTTLTIPFNISNVDSDSISVTINDNDPILMVNPAEEGFHIIGTTLYWHTYYNLKAGDKVYIQYVENIV